MGNPRKLSVEVELELRKITTQHSHEYMGLLRQELLSGTSLEEALKKVKEPEYDEDGKVVEKKPTKKTVKKTD